MEQRNDLILREIEKLSLFLQKLIKNISGTNTNEIESRINQINEALITEFDLSIDAIIKFENNELLSKISDLHESNIENLAELLHEIVKKLYQENTAYGFDRKELARKAIVLIEYIDENSDTFSMDRMHLKDALKKLL